MPWADTNWAETLLSIVFVTGNPNKLREVQEILSQGGNPISIESQSLESVPLNLIIFFFFVLWTWSAVYWQFPKFKGRRSKSLQQNVGAQPNSSGALVSQKTRHSVMKPWMGFRGHTSSTLWIASGMMVWIGCWWVLKVRRRKRYVRLRTLLVPVSWRFVIWFFFLFFFFRRDWHGFRFGSCDFWRPDGRENRTCTGSKGVWMGRCLWAIGLW